MALKLVKRSFVAASVLGLALSGCGKKSDSKTEEKPADGGGDGGGDGAGGPTNAGGGDGGGGVATGSIALNLMPTVDMSCGGKNCFLKDEAALALLGNGSTFLQTMQQFVFIVVGMPDEMYSTLSDEQKKLIDQGGFAQRIESIRKDVVASAVAYYADAGKGVTSCATAPAEGSFPLASDPNVSVSWTAPKLSAPAGNGYTGKYEKALVTTDGDVEYRFEFMCDKSAMVFASRIKSGAETKDIYAFFYEVKDGVMRSDFSLFDAGPVSEGMGLTLSFMMTRDADNNVEGWLSRTGAKNADDSEHLGFRYVVRKAGGSDKVSFFQTALGDGEDEHVTTAAWNASEYVTSTKVAGDVTGANGGSSAYVQGCATDWNQPRETMTVLATCAGMDLSTAPTPGLDAAGNGSMQWIDNNVKPKLTAIFE